ncbi:lysylphosphatidylglycerol synthase transmembrane domain-containing protein [Paenibacillus ihumii]|uniref:lysylphosphatidylglycerol synthase transmembrane domain-containing protein n=1 Tax=Paenibacillus ihumii TaxID=687436 RepID=UPI0006D771AD|nr:lysylphosphatidylglycerol synthase transmembrane domain-containing protein [Paenibacillus ihumii]
MKIVITIFKHKSFKIVFRLLVTVSLLIYAFSKFSIAESITVIKSANFSWFGVALLLNIITVLLQGHKWFYINRYLGINIPYTRTQQLNWISNFYGFFTPGKLGGDAYRFISLNKTSTGKTISFASTMIEKLSTLYAVFFLGALSAFYVGQVYSDIEFSPLIYLFLVSIIGILIVSLFYKQIKVRLDKARPQNSLAKKVTGFLSIIFNNQNTFKTVLIVFVYSLFYQIVSSIIVYVCSISLSMQFSFFDILLVFSISTLVTALPISISGIGVRETIYVTLLGAMGGGSTSSLSLSVLVFLSGLFIVLIGGVMSLKKLDLKSDDEKVC